MLEELGNLVKNSSLCGLGQGAPNPVLTTIKYFRDEYLAHIVDKRCPAKVCKALIEYYIDEDKCTGCLLCLRNCPTNAITKIEGHAKQDIEAEQPDQLSENEEGKKKGKKKAGTVCHINSDICVKCGVCFANCRAGAVLKKDKPLSSKDIISISKTDLYSSFSALK